MFEDDCYDDKRRLLILKVFEDDYYDDKGGLLKMFEGDLNAGRDLHPTYGLYSP